MLKYTKIIKAIRKIDWFVNKPSIYIDGMTSYKKMKECFIKKLEEYQEVGTTETEYT